MIETPVHHANEKEQFLYALVPLRRDFLQQASLFDESKYPLPKIIPGNEAVIVDSDEGYHHNFKRGMVTGYNFLTGLHTIQIESVEALYCNCYEIVRARG